MQKEMIGLIEGKSDQTTVYDLDESGLNRLAALLRFEIEQFKMAGVAPAPGDQRIEVLNEATAKIERAASEIQYAVDKPESRLARVNSAKRILGEIVQAFRDV